MLFLPLILAQKNRLQLIGHFLRTRDGKGINTPRELIQLFSYSETIELKKLETGVNNLLPNHILDNH
jgi:ribosomal 50S subunit-associated protein YjgA (DUF615 family)